MPHLEKQSVSDNGGNMQVKDYSSLNTITSSRNLQNMTQDDSQPESEDFHSGRADFNLDRAEGGQSVDGQYGLDGPRKCGVVLDGSDARNNCIEQITKEKDGDNHTGNSGGGSTTSNGELDGDGSSNTATKQGGGGLDGEETGGNSSKNESSDNRFDGDISRGDDQSNTAQTDDSGVSEENGISTDVGEDGPQNVANENTNTDSNCDGLDGEICEGVNKNNNSQKMKLDGDTTGTSDPDSINSNNNPASDGASDGDTDKNDNDASDETENASDDNIESGTLDGGLLDGDAVVGHGGDNETLQDSERDGDTTETSDPDSINSNNNQPSDGASDGDTDKNDNDASDKTENASDDNIESVTSDGGLLNGDAVVGQGGDNETLQDSERDGDTTETSDPDSINSNNDQPSDGASDGDTDKNDNDASDKTENASDDNIEIVTSDGGLLNGDAVVGQGGDNETLQDRERDGDTTETSDPDSINSNNDQPSDGASDGESNEDGDDILDGTGDASDDNIESGSSDGGLLDGDVGVDHGGDNKTLQDSELDGDTTETSDTDSINSNNNQPSEGASDGDTDKNGNDASDETENASDDNIESGTSDGGLLDGDAIVGHGGDNETLQDSERDGNTTETSDPDSINSNNNQPSDGASDGDTDKNGDDASDEAKNASIDDIESGTSSAGLLEGVEKLDHGWVKKTLHGSELYGDTTGISDPDSINSYNVPASEGASDGESHKDVDEISDETKYASVDNIEIGASSGGKLDGDVVPNHDGVINTHQGSELDVDSTGTSDAESINSNNDQPSDGASDGDIDDDSNDVYDQTKDASGDSMWSESDEDMVVGNGVDNNTPQDNKVNEVPGTSDPNIQLSNVEDSYKFRPDEEYTSSSNDIIEKAYNSPVDSEYTEANGDALDGDVTIRMDGDTDVPQVGEFDKDTSEADKVDKSSKNVPGDENNFDKVHDGRQRKMSNENNNDASVSEIASEVKKTAITNNDDGSKDVIDNNDNKESLYNPELYG